MTKGSSLSRLLAAAVAFASLAVGAHAEAPAPPPPKPAQIDRNSAIVLIRSVLIALDQANKTGNYTVLRDLGAPGFSAANTASSLTDIFANARRDKADMEPALVTEPQLTVPPEIDGRGMLHMAGFFPSEPRQINFELLFASIDGEWRLFGVSTNLGPASTAAPPAPPPAKSESQKKPASKPQPRKPAATSRPKSENKSENKSEPEPEPPQPQSQPQP